MIDDRNTWVLQKERIEISDNHYEHFDGAYQGRPLKKDEKIKVIEYSAYESVVKENERLKAKHTEAYIVSLENENIKFQEAGKGLVEAIEDFCYESSNTLDEMKKLCREVLAKYGNIFEDGSTSTTINDKEK